MIWEFDSIKAEMERYLKLQPQWNTVEYFGVYSRLIDVVAYILEKFALTCDILYNTSSWVRTSSLKTLAMMAKAFSYTAHRKVGAFGSVYISADSTFSDIYTYLGNQVTIPKWTRITDTSGNSSVYLTEDCVYYTGTVGNMLCEVKEGIPKSFTYVAKGLANEQITIYSGSIDNDIYDVYIVNSSGAILNTVNVVDNLYFIENTTDYYCTVKTSDDFQSVIITFGDGIDTRKLNANERVLFKYADTKGASGNIESINVLTVFKSTFTDSIGNIVTLYVKNPSAVSDGKDYEDIESIRNNGKNLFQAGYRCGTSSDYKAVLESFPFIYKAQVWTVADLGGSTLLSEQNKVFAAAITSTGDDLNNEQKLIVAQQLDTRYKSPTEVFEFKNLSKIYIMFNVIGKIANKTIPVVSQIIKDTLHSDYSTLNTDFQVNVYSSNYTKTIDDIDEVVYHETTIKLMEYNVPFQWSNQRAAVFYNSGVNVNKILLKEDSVQIWIKRKIAGVWQTPLQIAESSGSTITGINGYTIQSGNINYSEGKISFVVMDILNDVGGVIYGERNPSDSQALGYILTVAYNTKDGDGLQVQNVRLPYRNQITDIDEDFIFTTLSI